MEFDGMENIYISTGNSDDKLTQHEWAQFVGLVDTAIRHRAAEIHGFWLSPSNACWCIDITSEFASGLKHVLAGYSVQFRQDSIAWAVAQTEFIGASQSCTPATEMCECAHHWSVHRESGQTGPDDICHGYTGSATPGPYEPCRCTGFRAWNGPRDARTGEPVRPLTMTTAPPQPAATLRPDEQHALAHQAMAKLLYEGCADQHVTASGTYYTLRTDTASERQNTP